MAPFSGNTANGADNGIYITSTSPSLPPINLQAKTSRSISFDDAISGQSPTGINVNLNKGDDYDGAIKFSTSMTLGQVTQHNGTFELSGNKTTLKSNYTLNQDTYEVKDRATGAHETFNYSGGAFKLDGTLDVGTFNQNDGDLKAGTGDNLDLRTNGTMEVDDYQLKNGSLTLGNGADKLAITKITLSQNTTLTVEQGFSCSIGSMIDNGGTIILESGSKFTQQKVEYTSPKTELNLSAGSTFEVSSGSYTLSDGATVKVSGLGSSIKAQTIALKSNSTLHFTIDDSVLGHEPDNAMLSLNQTAADATTQQRLQRPSGGRRAPAQPRPFI